MPQPCAASIKTQAQRNGHFTVSFVLLISINLRGCSGLTGSDGGGLFYLLLSRSHSQSG